MRSAIIHLDNLKNGYIIKAITIALICWYFEVNQNTNVIRMKDINYVIPKL